MIFGETVTGLADLETHAGRFADDSEISGYAMCDHVTGSGLAAAKFRPCILINRRLFRLANHARDKDVAGQLYAGPPKRPNSGPVGGNAPFMLDAPTPLIQPFVTAARI